MAKKTAVEKRDHAPAPIVELLAVAKGANYPPGRMLIASPEAVQVVVKQVPKGRVMTMGSLRQALAMAYDADYACPLTTGIFLRIVAEAAEEERAAGMLSELAYWRVVRDDGQLLEKLPGGPAAQAKRLKAEGHSLVTHAKLPKLADVEAVAWQPKNDS